MALFILKAEGNLSSVHKYLMRVVKNTVRLLSVVWSERTRGNEPKSKCSDKMYMETLFTVRVVEV